MASKICENLKNYVCLISSKSKKLFKSYFLHNNNKKKTIVEQYFDEIASNNAKIHIDFMF